MTSNVPMGYCPHCKKNVLLKRQDIDACLAIILLIFTAGIGLLIYLILYYSKKENRCVHCGTEVTRFLNDLSADEQILPYNPPSEDLKALPKPIITDQTDIANYCPLCGENLGNRKPKFCPHCGSKL